MLAASLTAASGAQAAAAPQLDVYVGDLSRSQIAKLVELGVDRHEMELSRAAGSIKENAHVEVILSGEQAEKLKAEGVELETKKVDGQTVTQRATREAAAGFEVCKQYDGIKEEFEQDAPDSTRPITKSVNDRQDRPTGKDIIALKVTLGAPLLKDGAKPSVAVHRRPARPRVDHAGDEPPADAPLLDGYGTDRADHQAGQHDRAVVRAGRQPGRLRLHVHRRATGCGARTCATTTATARSPPATASTSTATSPTSGATTTRAPRPTRRARPTAARRRTPSPRPRRSTACSSGSRFEFFVNYHSAAELLLYGVGWQVSTPRPDDLIYEAMAGDDAHPAVPGYDPDISAELYTTNGETDSHVAGDVRHARLHAGDVAPARRRRDSTRTTQWDAEDCAQRLQLPRRRGADPGRVREEHPVRAGGRRVGAGPGRPGLGRRPQRAGLRGRHVRRLLRRPADGRRRPPSARCKHLQLQLPDQRRHDQDRRASRSGRAASATATRTTTTTPSSAATVKGASAGDKVEVWFTGERKDGRRDATSRASTFTYTRQAGHGREGARARQRGLHGVNPTYPAPHDGAAVRAGVRRRARAPPATAPTSGTSTRRASRTTSACSATTRRSSGTSATTGSPRTPRTSSPTPPLRRAARHRASPSAQQYLTMAVRDYLNEGGKLHQRRRDRAVLRPARVTTSSAASTTASTGDPTAECVVTTGVQGLFDDCLLLADDFRQYWLGAYTRVEPRRADRRRRHRRADRRADRADLGGTADEPARRGGRVPADQRSAAGGAVPAVPSQGAAEYDFTGEPVHARRGHQLRRPACTPDDSYMRLTKTIDLRAVAAADAPSCSSSSPTTPRRATTT